MKRKTLKVTVAAAALGLGTALAAGPGLAHGPGGQDNRSGSGMHGGQMGPGMMGHMGGMMGHMGSGMMGPGTAGQGGCPYHQAALTEELTVESVTKFLERRLSHMGNDRLKVGEVKAKDDKTIVAEIVTVDDSLVQRIEFDRKTGQRRQVR